MINLLPLEYKQEIRAGRVNSLLVRYVVMLAGVIVLIALQFGLAYFYMKSTEQAALDAISQNENNRQEITSKQQEVETFRRNLATSKQILDKQINYSSIVLKVASVIPNGVIIDQLTLDPSTFGSATTLNARAKNENAARALKKSLQESPYFSGVHFNTISTSGDDGYPYVITISLIFKKELLNE